MSVHDYVTSLIRTFVPIWVGAGLTALATHLGIVLSEDTSASAALVAVGFVTAAYYAAARALEARFPALGRLLLALGLTTSAPEYWAAPVAPARGKDAIR